MKSQDYEDIHESSGRFIPKKGNPNSGQSKQGSHCFAPWPTLSWKGDNCRNQLKTKSIKKRIAQFDILASVNWKIVGQDFTLFQLLIIPQERQEIGIAFILKGNQHAPRLCLGNSSIARYLLLPTGKVSFAKLFWKVCC